jgi:SAM-dependent methyltransferase
MDEQTAAALKERAHTTWAAGDFDEIAKVIWSVGGGLVERVGVSAGQDVLDIAAGTGNAAIPAAATGAAVTASDLTPELFVAGRANAEAAGVQLEWVEADAENLPFEDESFDIVLSTFGIMFAPRHEVAAAEAVRVLRPGGRFGFCCWKPEGRIGEFFQTIGKHMPPPPEGFVPPPAWGVREHVEELFADKGVTLEFFDDIVDQKFDSPEHTLELFSEKFGPMVMAKAALEPQGKWEALRSDLLDMYERNSEPTDDGGVVTRAEYLTTIGTKSG